MSDTGCRMVIEMTSTHRTAPHDHVVDLYETDLDLVSNVTRFLVEGFDADGVTVLIATAEHREVIEGLLADRMDLPAARRAGRYVSLDASDVLASFMVDGTPDAGRFEEVVGGLVAEAARGGAAVRAFGEMVSLLWNAGNIVGALKLEVLWNRLSQDHQFSLYCAYPMAALVAGDDLDSIRQLCNQHSSLVPPSSYRRAEGLPGDADALERVVVFVALPEAVGAARRFVMNTVVAWGLDSLASDVALVTSELAANVIRHVSCPFRVTVRRETDSVTVSVEDLSSAVPYHRQSADVADGDGGRGLPLVATLSSSWGTQVMSTGKVVWVECAECTCLCDMSVSG